MFLILISLFFSLVDLFQSPQFSENLSYFQQLLLEGTFDVSSSEVTPDECRTLKKLVLGSSTKSKWVEYYMKIKARLFYFHDF